jgi:SAM-dependent methyltransferase
MKAKHHSSEARFYSLAYSDILSRRARGFGWGYEPSETVDELVCKHGLDSGPGDRRALDIGCGDGRHTGYFLSKGFSVTGVDFCNEALNHCRELYRGEPAEFYKVDLTEAGALTKLNTFNIVLDWSVQDHIRRQYLQRYLKNVICAIKEGGYLISAQFGSSLPGLFRSRDYKVKDGHYSRGYSVETLSAMLKPLQVVDSISGVLEDEINNISFVYVLAHKGCA